MEDNQHNTDIPIRISIQVNGKKTARVESSSSITVANFRAYLLELDIQLPQDAQFLDAQDYPVLVINEESWNISRLLVSTNDGQTIRLRSRQSATDDGQTITARTRQPATNAAPQLFTSTKGKWLIFVIVTVLLVYYAKPLVCPVLVQMDSSSLVCKFYCTPDSKPNRNSNSNPGPNPPDSYTDTTEYLKDKIMTDASGTEILVSTNTGLEKVELKDNEYFVSVYDELVRNEATYKADYEWYNDMAADPAHCHGRFEEKVINSVYIIRDTPESIKQFTNDKFQEWPDKMRAKLNIERRLTSIVSDDIDEFNIDANGKIGSNAYLVAWRREPDNTIRIQTYTIIFERTAGPGCRFNLQYWEGQRGRITNARKYFLLTKAKTNQIDKDFLMILLRAA